jgi:hypothetical protein
MKSIDLNTVEFRVLEGDEQKDLAYKLHLFRRNIFLKRMGITLFLIGVFVVFQLIARRTVPNRFKPTDTVEKMLLISLAVFVAVNVLSYLWLLFETKVLFDTQNTPVMKVNVRKKEVVEVLAVRGTTKQRHLVCDMDEGFILNRIYVSGPIVFSNVKAGETIYIACRETLSSGKEYYYVA